MKKGETKLKVKILKIEQGDMEETLEWSIYGIGAPEMNETVRAPMIVFFFYEKFFFFF